MQHVSVSDVVKAVEEEEAGNHISDAHLRDFVRTASVARSHAVGSDSNRHANRQAIWGICTVYSKPHIWLTINPADHHDPIAMFLAGADVDLDDFVASAGPTASQRSACLVADPFTSAEYFYIVVKAVLEFLIGVTATDRQVLCDPGILGLVVAYFAMVEAQGRAVLHLHCLLWLANTPDCSKWADLYLDGAFLRCLNEYVRHCIKAHVDGLSDKRGLAPAPSPHPSWSRPPNPNADDWHLKALQMERDHVESSQFHKCTPFPHGCAPVPGSRHKQCKRGFPFECSDEVKIEKNGNWTVCYHVQVLHCAYLWF